MLTGCCLCGSVAYEVDADPGPIIHCHCQTCRKTHGSAFSTVTNVPRTAFAGPKVKACSEVSNLRPARRGISAPTAGRTSSPRARARTRSCFGWGAWTRRLPIVPKCISGDRIARPGSTQKTSCRSGRKAHRQRAASANSPAALSQALAGCKNQHHVQRENCARR